MGDRWRTFRTLRILALFVGMLPCLLWGGDVNVSPVDYVIQISVDGLRADVLQELVSTSPDEFPNFRRLELEGAYTYNARADYTYTETIPNHLSMITGRPVDQPAGMPNTVQHGYSNNFPAAEDTVQAQGNPNVSYISSVFDVAHDHGLSTAVYASKTRLQILERSYDATHGAPDLIEPDNGSDKIDIAQFVDGSSAGIVDALVANMSETPQNYSFLHIVEGDTVGHFSGWGSPEYNGAVATADARIGQVLALIDGNPLLRDNTALVITADHGGGAAAPRGPGGGFPGRPGGGFSFPTDRGHDDATAAVNYTIPFFVWGAGLPAGSDLYEAAINRFDPRDSRPGYDAMLQPLWNGDSGNMALALLGLEPIPDSTLVPMFPVDTVSGAVHLWAGDTNMDLEFDQEDVVLVQAAGKYLTGQPATWGEGDWDGAPGGQPGDPPLGNGQFDQRDIVAALAHGRYLGGPYAAVVREDSLVSDSDTNMLKAAFGPSVGSLSLGKVAPSSLSEEFVLGTSSAVGFPAGGGDLGDVDLIYVPEPMSGLLLAIGFVIGLVALRRRAVVTVG